ncbi:MAG: hypothetical protein AB7T48_14235, partial [Solirubrobacterales bacterium]
MTAGAIFVSTAIGIWAERRWAEGAANASRKALVVLLYVFLPPVIFFNLAAADIDVDHGVGLGLALVAVTLAAVLAWWVASRVLKLPRFQVGAVVCVVLSVNT